MLFETLNADKIKFMKEKKSLELNTVRQIIAEIKNEEIRVRKKIGEGEILAVIVSLVKKGNESLDYAVKANDEARITEYSQQLEVLKSYLPVQMTEADVRDLAQKIITHGGFSGKKDLGKVMQAIRPQTAGRADGKLVSKIVTELLG
jgi:uncharacterized protein YqeY